MPSLLGTGRGFHVRTEGEFDEAIKAALAETRHFTLIEAELEKVGYLTSTRSVGRTDGWRNLIMTVGCRDSDILPTEELNDSIYISVAIFSRRKSVQNGTCSSESPCNTTAPS